MYVETFFGRDRVDVDLAVLSESESGGWHQTPVMQLEGMVLGSDPFMIWKGEQERESLSVTFHAQAIRWT